MPFATKLFVRAPACLASVLLLIGVAAAQQTTPVSAAPPLRLTLQDED